MNIFQRILTASLVALVSLLIVVQAEAQDFSNWTATSDEKAVVQDSAAQAESGLSAAVKEDVTQAVDTAAAAATDAATLPSLTAETALPLKEVQTFDESALKDASSPEELLKMVGAPLGVELLENTGGKYTLGPNDVIEVTVLRHPEVSGEYPINMEGNIQYEFVGDINISGKDKDGAADIIRAALSEYIVAPEVSVKITQYNSKVVYVVGEVFRPGKIFMRGDTITVREALVQAGLPQLSGVTKRSRLIKPSENGRPKRKLINVYALIYEGDLRYNDIMESGDVLYIPPTFLTKIMRAISPVAAPIGQAAGARVGVDAIGTTNTNNGY